MNKVIVWISLAAFALPNARGADWPMWGGEPTRNMVNTGEKNIPTTWDIKTGRNVKWTARLGSQTYGNPVISKGKIFLGTNNQGVRQAKARGDSRTKEISSNAFISSVRSNVSCSHGNGRPCKS